MALRITFNRCGKKKKPYFEIILKNDNTPHKKIEKLGYFNFLENPKKLALNLNKIKYWIKNGAQIKNKKLFFHIYFLIKNEKL